MTRNRTIYHFFLLSALVNCTGMRDATAALPTAYHVTDLGTLGGETSYGIGINDSGQVSGYSYTAGSFHAFLWKPMTANGVSGTMHDLGTLGGGSSNGFGINDSGQISGDSDGLAFVWTPMMANGTSGGMDDLGTLGGSSSEAHGINASGQVAGASHTGEAELHAFLYDGALHDLGTLGGTSSNGFDINGSRQVTGISQTTEDAAEHAFLWTATTPNGTSGTMVDLGTLGGIYSVGIGINDSGRVTGRSDGRAFLWTPTTPNGASGTMHDLGTLGGSNSEGHGINDSGHVTGGSHTTEASDYHAFLYTSDSGMVDLNTLIDPLSGWVLQFGAGINDAGQITGQGLIGGEQHAFLLTPVAVPEPTSLALLVLGLPLIVGRESRRSGSGSTRGAHGPVNVSVIPNWSRNTNPR